MSDAASATFEELRRELEEIVGKLERGDVAVDEAIRALAARRGAAPALRGAARGGRRPHRGARRADADDTGAPGL